MERLRVGDQVVVVRGNHKGKRGKISRVLVEKDAVLIEGVNVVKRHMRATPQRAGGILEIEAPLHRSKVALIDPESGTPTRVSFKLGEDGKQRIAKSGATIGLPVLAEPEAGAEPATEAEG